MTWKTVVIGGLVFFDMTWVVSFVTGPVIHEGILDAAYMENSQFWQPALVQDPPDMASLMPRWIGFGLLGALIFAGLYACFRSALSGPGWKRGAIFGLGIALFTCTQLAGWSGIFYLPAKIWLWWGIEGFFYNIIGGAVLGLVSAKLDPHD